MKFCSKACFGVLSAVIILSSPCLAFYNPNANYNPSPIQATQPASATTPVSTIQTSQNGVYQPSHTVNQPVNTVNYPQNQSQDVVDDAVNSVIEKSINGVFGLIFGR